MRMPDFGNRTALLLSVVFSFWLVACATTVGEVDKLKDWTAEQEYVRVADHAVECSVGSEGCNQVHLLKGDACFRLAVLDDNKRRLDCAIANIEAGIEQTTDWSAINTDRAQFYENLSEALRRRRDQESGAAAASLNSQLLATSDEFLAAEPQNLAAIYLRNNARLYALRPAVTNPSQHPNVCRDLGSIMRDIEGNESRASGTKYQPNYERLAGDVEAAMSLARCTT